MSGFGGRREDSTISGPPDPFPLGRPPTVTSGFAPEPVASGDCDGAGSERESSTPWQQVAPQGDSMRQAPLVQPEEPLLMGRGVGAAGGRPSPWQRSIDLDPHLGGPGAVTPTEGGDRAAIEQLGSAPSSAPPPDQFPLVPTGSGSSEGVAPQLPPGGPPPHEPAVPPHYAPEVPPQVPGSAPPQPSYPHPGRGHRTALLLSAGVALLLAGVVTAVTVTVTVTGPGDADSGGAAPSMVSALTAEGSTPGGTGTPQANTPPEQPLIPGYQVVVAPESGAAYDVPAGWLVAPAGTSGSFGVAPNTISGKGYATDGKNYCPGSTRTVAFLTGSKNPNSAGAAAEIGVKTAGLAYPSTSGAITGAATTLDSIDGMQHGAFVETKGTVTKAKPGCARTFSVYTVAFPNEDGNFVMMIAADTGVPNAVDAATARRVFSTIRAHGG